MSGQIKTSFRKGGFLTSAALLALMCSYPAAAQIFSENPPPSATSLNLAPDSPFRDPDTIYLEADELINNQETGILTASGHVEGRYQDRTVRADKIIYALESGRVLAIGNVTLIDGSGSTQYAEKIELTSGLGTGAATNLLTRLPNGGTAGAAFGTRTTEDGYQLYNAFYTACKPCQDEARTRPPTWQLKARQVSQDKDKNIIKYRDAVFQLMGVPILYTPYMAHPDPSAKRASGWLAPYVGLSSSKGFNVRLPYFLNVNDHTDFIATPRIYQNVNPLLEIDAKRLFYSGEINLNASVTYGSIFDRDGHSFKSTDTFIPTSEAPLGKRLRSHTFADGHFDLTDRWSWGFTGQGASDDLYLNRYDLDEGPGKRGVYDGDSRRLISQAYGMGQDDSFRFAVSAYGFQSLRTTIRQPDEEIRTFNISHEDDSTLPIIAPSIDFSKFWTDPLLKGRLELAGNFTSLTRKIGSDYQRGTAGASWDKTFITPGGIEMKPFGNVRYDDFSFETEEDNKVSFDRSLGQLGADIRWPFIRPGKNVDWILEPRGQMTQSFGKGKNDRFQTETESGTSYSLLQDSLDIDLDHILLWSPDKATGYDLWQEGFRADLGGQVSALWNNNYARLFLGQSYASNYEDAFTQTSGLADGKTDMVGMFELGLGRRFNFNTRLRYDDDTQKFHRLDAGFSFNTDRLKLGSRYYKINNSADGLLSDDKAPNEEVTGNIDLRLTKNWSVKYYARHDIDADLTRRQNIGLIFEDECTRLEFLYHKNRFDSDIIRDSDGINIRLTLFTLGSTDD